MKRLTALLLVLVMAFSMTACKKNTNEDTNAPDTNPESTQAPANEGNGDTDGTGGNEAQGRSLEELTVGFAQMDNTNSWRIAETNDMLAKLEAAGIEVVYADAGADTAKQASDIEDMVAQGVDYIVLPPQEEDGLQGALQAAMGAGIPVILIDRGVNGEVGKDYTTAIMSDFIWEGQQVANRLIEITAGDPTNVVILQGTQGATATIDRQTGFMDAIDGSNLTVIADQTANFVMSDAQAVMENIIQAQGDKIDIVYAHNDDMAIGAIAALKAAGYKPGEDVIVASVDGSKAAMEAIIAGELYMTVSCSPFFGDIVIDTITKIEAGEDIPDFIVNQDTVYDKTNADVAKGF